MKNDPYEREKKAASRQAKSDLEKLFSESPLNKDKAQRIAEIKSLRGKPEHYPRMTDYWNAYGLPLEWEIQQIFLDHRDSKIVKAVLSELKRTAPTMDLKKQEMLAAKLNVMAVSTFDSEILNEIGELKKALLRS